MATVTSSRRRNERGSGSKKVAASTPKPRQTSVGNRGAQAGPMKPGTRTSGTSMVNSSSATMRQIQAKASAARAQAQGQPGIKGPIKLPNSQRAGVNLPKVGAGVVKPPAGQMNPVQSALLKAQGAAAKAAAQVKRGAKTAMARQMNTLATRGSVRPGRSIGSPGRGAVGGAIEQAATAALSPLARKAGTALGKSIKSAMTPKPTKKVADSFSGQYQKGGPSKKAAPKMSKAKSFDNAFASARNSGMKTFVWEGKKYNTKMRGEK
jgi:hypothetical protein